MSSNIVTIPKKIYKLLKKKKCINEVVMVT